MNLRDNDLASIIFTDVNGNSYTIKEMREYTPRVKWFSVNIDSSDDLDEIASRSDVYGSGSESEYYKIFEMNKEAISDVNFDISKLKSLVIPVP